MKINQILQGDCLEKMQSILPHSIDMVLADLPYGTTRNKWDSVIPLKELWENYQRVAKQNAPFVLFCSQPFTTQLGASNLPWLRYSLVWHKSKATGHLNAKKMPMKNHEDILVFYASPPTYNPQGLKYPRSVLSFPSEGVSQHPTQKPVALLEYLVRTFSNPGDLILDNCAGVGSTGVACVNTDRKFILIEKEESYCQIAADRIRKSKGR